MHFGVESWPSITGDGRRDTGGGRREADAAARAEKVVARNFLYGQPYQKCKNAQNTDFSKIP
jgi:hypothetical protein